MEYAAIAAVIAGLIGELVAGGQEGQAAALRQQMLDQFGPELLPHLEKLEAEQVGGSAFGKLKEDPSLRGRQLDTLSELEDIYRNEGTTSADRAAMELADQTVSNRAASDYQTLQQNLSARGLGSSGMAAALAAGSQQSNASDLATMARENTVAARGRALRALEAGGQLAGNIRGDDYRALSDAAAAQDRIALFDAAQRTDAQRYNAQLPQMAFDNAMALNVARSNAAAGVAGGYERGAQGARQTAGGIGQGLITWGTRKKEDDE